jgi:hypothetical protein
MAGGGALSMLWFVGMAVAFAAGAVVFLLARRAELPRPPGGPGGGASA